MSESEWATSTNPQAMLACLQNHGSASERKLRLFCCACCRRLWNLMPDERTRTAVEVTENYVDGLTSGAELLAASEAAYSVFATLPPHREDDSPDPIRMGAWAGWAVSGPDGGYAAKDARTIASVVTGPMSGLDVEVEVVAHAGLLRDIFGSPFAPITFLPEWRTEIVTALARGIYEERAWDRMAVLGDALEEAGADPELVRHCREPGIHVKGCHVLDAALDRS